METLNKIILVVASILVFGSACTDDCESETLRQKETVAQYERWRIEDRATIVELEKKVYRQDDYIEETAVAYMNTVFAAIELITKDTTLRHPEIRSLLLDSAASFQYQKDLAKNRLIEGDSVAEQARDMELIRDLLKIEHARGE